MNHPFIPLSREQHLLWTGIFTAATLLLMAGEFWANALLRNDTAPAGILSFEFAGTLANARLMIHSWDYTAKLRAAFGIGLDYLYLVAYSTTFSLACVYIAKLWASFPVFGRIGIVIAWLQWPAALFDSLENAALMALLFDSSHAWLPPFAYWMAAAKFALVGMALLYLLVGFFGLWWQIRANK